MRNKIQPVAILVETKKSWKAPVFNISAMVTPV